MFYIIKHISVPSLAHHFKHIDLTSLLFYCFSTKVQNNAHVWKNILVKKCGSIVDILINERPLISKPIIVIKIFVNNWIYYNKAYTIIVSELYVLRLYQIMVNLIKIITYTEVMWTSLSVLNSHIMRQVRPQ